MQDNCVNDDRKSQRGNSVRIHNYDPDEHAPSRSDVRLWTAFANKTRHIGSDNHRKRGHIGIGALTPETSADHLLAFHIDQALLPYACQFPDEGSLDALPDNNLFRFKQTQVMNNDMILEAT